MTAVYVRQSVDRADSISIETQQAHCLAHLPPMQAADCRIYSDRGYSGKNTDRPGLQRLLRDLDRGEIDRIVVYKLDRISRSVHDFTGLCDRLRQKGITFYSCEDGLTLDNTPAGAAMAQIMMVFAQFERETIICRVTDNYYARARCGMYLGGRAPFGYQKTETLISGRRTACYAPDPARAALVRRLFCDYLAPCASLGTLMRRLNITEGVPTQTGGPWCTAQLGRLLRSPVYVRADAQICLFYRARGAVIEQPSAAFDGVHGCYLYATRQGRTRTKFSDPAGAHLAPAPHEGLIPADTWLAVQQKLTRGRTLRGSGRGSHSWLSGRMQCEKCGLAMSVVHSAARDYLTCAGRKKGICPPRSHPLYLADTEQAVEQQLFLLCRRYRAVSLFCAVRDTPDRRRLTQEAAQLSDEISCLTENLSRLSSPDSIALAEQALNEKIRRQRACRDTLARLACPVPDAAGQADFLALPERWHAFSIEDKKRLAACFLRRVVVGDDTLSVFFAAPAPP